MEDRELLELAAKAAGVDGDYSVRADAIVNEDGYWMPHNDDGDAFRLAAKLHIDVEWRNDGRVQCFQLSSDQRPLVESSREDVEANLRRAIVRAAAEIGRSMP